ncbi:MAG: hypothetical protein PHE33_10720 [Bacteroidales bacterium]|nr:hypothetical protein [Bacteroidales bacterium]
MKRLFYVLIGMSFLGYVFQSCDPKDPPVSENVIEVTTDITSPTIWTANKIYIISVPDFGVKSTLTIEAGTVIKFKPNYIFMTIYDDGKIIANGTSTSPIVFTSYKDDNNGGDTNGDGGNTIAAAGDWGNIDLNGSTGSVFTSCKFLYGGQGSTASPTLNLSAGAQATIDNCTFAFNTGGKEGNFYIGALHADIAKNSTIITNNIFYNNILPLTIAAEININNSNYFKFNEIGNKFNGIFVAGNINKNTEWTEDEVAFVITSDNINVGIGKTLTLGNGVILKFVEGSTLTLSSGEPSLINYNGSGIFYTSFKDDDLLGDTNGDATNSAPAVADWTGIFLDHWKKSTGYADWENIKYNDPNPVAK